MGPPSKISAIIPTLNEADNIIRLIHHLRRMDWGVEIIVVDGGSTDGTFDLAREQGVRVIRSPRGRAAQMNAGAHQASGDVLWFLHADGLPRVESIAAMLDALQDPALVGGAFEYSLEDPAAFFRLVEFTSNLKNRILKTIYGDMGIFVRAEVFRRMGGYADLPLMEDMEFGRRLKKFGRIVILPPRIMTSARRWREEGVVWNVLRNWALQLAFSVGVPAEKLTRWYKFGNRK